MLERKGDEKISRNALNSVGTINVPLSEEAQKAAAEGKKLWFSISQTDNYVHVGWYAEERNDKC